MCLLTYKLDPTWYYTSQGLSWNAMLKKTKVQLELLSNSNTLLMLENDIYEHGISMISKRYAKTNTKYISSFIINLNY